MGKTKDSKDQPWTEEDREDRLQRLRQELEELGGEMTRADDGEELPVEVEEQFLEHVLAWERAPQTTYLEALDRAGKRFPAPEELHDQQLSEKLWELINALALLHVYLHCTDHLSDRELYHELWYDCLREETVLFPENPDYACHLDLIGSGSEEDIHLYLKHYADEESRRQWAEGFSDEAMPEHEDPPYDRDRHLPQRPTLPEASMEEQ